VAVLQRTRSSCLPLRPESTEARSVRDRSCEKFNDAVVAELAFLSRERKISVVVAGKWLSAAWHHRPFASTDRPFLESVTRFGHKSIQPGEFERRLREILDELDALNLNAVVVAPFAELPRSVPACLVHNSSADCGHRSPVESLMSQRTRQVMERVVADYPAVHLWTAVDVIC